MVLKLCSEEPWALLLEMSRVARDWLEKDQQRNTQDPPQPQANKTSGTPLFVVIMDFHMFLLEESIQYYKF